MKARIELTPVNEEKKADTTVSLSLTESGSVTPTSGSRASSETKQIQLTPCKTAVFYSVRINIDPASLDRVDTFLTLRDRASLAATCHGMQSFFHTYPATINQLEALTSKFKGIKGEVKGYLAEDKEELREEGSLALSSLRHFDLIPPHADIDWLMAMVNSCSLKDLAFKRDEAVRISRTKIRNFTACYTGKCCAVATGSAVLGGGALLSATLLTWLFCACLCSTTSKCCCVVPCPYVYADPGTCAPLTTAGKITSIVNSTVGGVIGCVSATTAYACNWDDNIVQEKRHKMRVLEFIDHAIRHKAIEINLPQTLRKLKTQRQIQTNDQRDEDESEGSKSKR